MYKNKSVSVILLMYNPNFFKVKKTIESILQQENIDFELIIADDASENNLFTEISELLKNMNLMILYSLIIARIQVR